LTEELRDRLVKGRLSLPLAYFLAIGAIVQVNVSCAAQNADDVIKELQFNGETMSDYHTLGSRRMGVMINRITGQKLSQWATNPVGPTRTDFTWGDPNNWPSAPGKPISVEEWSIKSNCAGGRTFVWLDAYRNDYADSSVRNRFKIGTTRAEIRVGGGPWTDITDGGCGVEGQPYALHDVTTNPYGLRVWGNIYQVDGVTVGRRFFWQETISYVPNANNSCWTKDPDRVRPAIKQEEAWWDSTNGWKPGSGSMGVNGEPDGAQVTYGRWQMVGKGAGEGWNLSLRGSSANQFCLQYQGTW